MNTMTALMDIDPALFKQSFNRLPFLITHRLSDNQMFDLKELVLLARRLPAKSIEYNSGNVPISINPLLTPHTGLSVEETLHRIEQCNSWMVIKNIERDSAYSALLDTCLEEVAEKAGLDAHAMYDRQGFIFISSPGAVTPLHIDPEHNFLLQIRGWKNITVFDPGDRGVVSEPDLEKFHTGGHRNLEIRPGLHSKSRVCRLQAGRGLHIPVTAPHWVRNGDEVSVSFSLTFRTIDIEDRSHIYKINAALRKCGFRPVPPGVSAVRDGAKIRVFNLLRNVRRMMPFRTVRGNRA